VDERQEPGFQLAQHSVAGLATRLTDLVFLVVDSDFISLTALMTRYGAPQETLMACKTSVMAQHCRVGEGLYQPGSVD